MKNNNYLNGLCIYYAMLLITTLECTPIYEKIIVKDYAI